MRSWKFRNLFQSCGFWHLAVTGAKIWARLTLVLIPQWVERDENSLVVLCSVGAATDVITGVPEKQLLSKIVAIKFQSVSFKSPDRSNATQLRAPKDS